MRFAPDWLEAFVKKQKKSFLFLAIVILSLGLLWIFPSAIIIEFHKPEKLLDGFDDLNANESGADRGSKEKSYIRLKPGMSFEARKMMASFEQCAKTPGLDLAAFLAGYRQLCLFMIQVIGKAVSLGVKELEVHVNAVDQLLRSSNAEHHYDTIESMINYEHQEHISKGAPYKGAFSCLYLHRTTNFIVSFLHLLFSDSSPSSSSSSAAAVTAYDATVGKRHSWFIRKTAHFASHLLPSKDAFLSALRIDGSLDRAREFTRNGEKIFEATQKLYADKSLLEIAP